MSNEPNDLGPKKGETATQFKGRIEDTQRDLKRAEAQAAAQVPSAPVPAPVAQVSAPAPAAVTPAPVAPKGVTGNPEVDAWWDKKGFKSTEDMAQSYRELEREMHRKAQETKAAPVQPAPQAPAPNYPPYYPGPMPAYQAPQQFAPQPVVDVERLAKQYGLASEDFEKVAPMIHDMAQSLIRQELGRVLPPLTNSVQSVNREVSRQKELVDLMSDPTFKNPQVQFELHRVLEETPSIFETQAQPMRYAYEKALTRIARANLGGSTVAPNAPQDPAPASRPPTTAGGNGGGGNGAPSGAAPEQVTPEVFARMSMVDKRAYLQAAGAIGR